MFTQIERAKSNFYCWCKEKNQSCVLKGLLHWRYRQPRANAELLIWFRNPNGFQCLMRHRPKDYSALWKPVYDTSGPRGQQHSIAVAFSALRFTIGPLGNERPNKWIHQSVCVLLSVCIWDAVRPRRAQSPGTQRKGMPLLAGLMNGWHAAPWQRRMWQPPSRKRGAVLNHQGEITWHFTTSSCLAASSAGWA